MQIDEPAVLEGIDALNSTAEILANTEDMSFERSLEVLQHQEAMDLVQASIRELDPEAYGGAVHDLLPSIGTKIFVKGEISPEAAALVEGLDNVTIESVNFSLDEVIFASQETARILRDLGFEDIAVGADTRTHSIDVELSTSEFDDLALAMDDLDPALSGIALPVKVSVFDGQIDVPTAGVYGGGQLAIGTSNTCTAAFTVTNSSGASGVLTAAHCPSSMSKYKTVGGGSYNLYYQGAALSSLGDAEWHTTSGTEYDDFYYTHTAKKDVSGLKNHLYMDVGDIVCRYGRKTGNGGCQDIINLSVSAGGYSSMIRVDSTGDDFGDSGGPWYTGNTAWGIHHGHFNSNHDGIFTAVSIVDGNLGVTLKTS